MQQVGSRSITPWDVASNKPLYSYIFYIITCEKSFFKLQNTLNGHTLITSFLSTLLPSTPSATLIICLSRRPAATAISSEALSYFVFFFRKSQLFGCRHQLLPGDVTCFDCSKGLQNYYLHTFLCEICSVRKTDNKSFKANTVI